MLIRDTLRYLPAQLLAPLAQLASMVAWTHWLAPVEMGAFTLVATTQELAYLACLSWFSVYALRALPGREADAAARRNYLQTENIVVATGCALLLVVAIVSAIGLPGGLTWQSGSAVAAFFVTRALNAHYAERARAQSAFVAYTLLQVCGPVGGLLLGLLALRTVAPTADVLWASYAAAQALGTVLAWPGLGMARRWARPDAAVVRGALAFGGPMLALSALGWVAENHLRYLVQWQSGAVELGLIAVGWGLGRRCASVASMLVTTAAFPIASRLLNEGRRGDAIEQLRVNAGLLMAATLPVCAGLVFIGPALVELAVAPAYREATIAVLGLAVVSGAVRCLHVHVSDQWLVLERRFALVAWIDLIEIVACALASAVGLAVFGLRGAVAGQLVGSALALAASLAWAGRRGFRWPLAGTCKVVLATAVMSLVLAALDDATGVAGIVLRVAVGAAVYAAALGASHLGSVRMQVARLRGR